MRGFMVERPGVAARDFINTPITLFRDFSLPVEVAGGTRKRHQRAVGPPKVSLFLSLFLSERGTPEIKYQGGCAYEKIHHLPRLTLSHRLPETLYIFREQPR